MTDWSAGAAWVDEEVVPIGEAKLPLLDWGFLHSDATYDVAHVWQGRFFRLNDHIDRFFYGMSALRMSIPHDPSAVADILERLVVRAGLRDAYVEMICTRGMPAPGSRDPRTCTNRFYAFAVPFIWIADPEKQETGLHMVITGRRRIPPESVDPRIKNYHWLDMVMALFDAYDEGGETALMVDGAGNVVEGPGFNVFGVFGNQIVTPEKGVLEGVTRRTVFELVPRCGYEVRADRLPERELRRADEVFISSTAGGIMPVTRIDDRPVGDGRPGPITGRIRDAYWALHEDPDYIRMIDYG